MDTFTFTFNFAFIFTFTVTFTGRPSTSQLSGRAGPGQAGTKY